MAKLSEVQGKPVSDGGGASYIRCFGDTELGHLLSRVQSLIIRNGFELERLVTEAIGNRLIDDLDDFLSYQIMQPGVRVAVKKTIKKSNTLVGSNIEPDFLVFERSTSSQRCYIVELKDGHEFDTKSSAKEQANLHEFLNLNAAPFQYYQSHCRICGFNAETKAEIQQGFKWKIDIDEAMTGREFCELVGVNYDQIVNMRANDRQINFDQFISDLMSIDRVRNSIIDRIGD